MNQICGKCGLDFVIDEADLAFYAKIAVPVPTLCPEDRAQRRWAWRSKNFYLRNCDNCRKKTMSWIGPENKKLKCYCEQCFISDEFEAAKYGRDFDFGRGFFEQFNELTLAVPRHISNAINNENSEYIICAHNNKNCYFIDEVDGCRDCYFGYNVQYCHDMVEALYVRDSEIGYELVKAEGCYAGFYSTIKYVFEKNSCYYDMATVVMKDVKMCDKVTVESNLHMKEDCVQFFHGSAAKVVR